MMAFRIVEPTGHLKLDFLNSDMGRIEFESFTPGLFPDQDGFVRDTFRFSLDRNKRKAAIFLDQINKANRLARRHWQTEYREKPVWVEYQINEELLRRYAKLVSIGLPGQAPGYLFQEGLELGVMDLVITREHGFRMFPPWDEFTDQGATHKSGYREQLLYHNYDPTLMNPASTFLHSYDYSNTTYTGPIHAVISPDRIFGDLPSYARFRLKREGYGAEGRPGGLIAKKLVKNITGYEEWKSWGPFASSAWASKLRLSYYNVAGVSSAEFDSELTATFSNGDIHLYQGNWQVYILSKTSRPSTLEDSGLPDDHWFVHYGWALHGAGTTPNYFDVAMPWKTLDYTSNSKQQGPKVAIQNMGQFTIPQASGAIGQLTASSAPLDYYISSGTTYRGQHPGTDGVYNHGFLMLPSDEGIFRYGNVGTNIEPNHEIFIDGESKNVVTYDTTHSRIIPNMGGGHPYSTGEFFQLTPGYYNIFFFLPFIEVTPDILYAPATYKGSQRNPLYFGPPTLYEPEGIASIGSVSIDAIPRWQLFSEEIIVDLTVWSWDWIFYPPQTVYLDTLSIAAAPRAKSATGADPGPPYPANTELSVVITGSAHPVIPMNTLMLRTWIQRKAHPLPTLIKTTVVMQTLELGLGCRKTDYVPTQPPYLPPYPPYTKASPYTVTTVAPSVSPENRCGVPEDLETAWTDRDTLQYDIV